MNEKATIPLTAAPPVTIVLSAWPTIARADASWCDRPDIPYQSIRSSSAWLRVRRHADGRTIVHGRAEYGSAYQGEREVSTYCGVVLGSGATPATLVGIIQKFCAELCAAVDPDHLDGVELARGVIADLPPEELY